MFEISCLVERLQKKFIKSTIISARPNWLRLIDKQGNTIQSLSMSNRDLIIQSNYFLALPSGLQEHMYAYTYILTVHTEEYQKFILALIIFDVFVLPTKHSGK